MKSQDSSCDFGFATNRKLVKCHQFIIRPYISRFQEMLNASEKIYADDGVYRRYKLQKRHSASVVEKMVNLIYSGSHRMTANARFRKLFKLLNQLEIKTCIEYNDAKYDFTPHSRYNYPIRRSSIDELRSFCRLFASESSLQDVLLGDDGLLKVTYSFV